MYSGVIGALPGAILWMLGVQGGNAERYKVLGEGQVTFHVDRAVGHRQGETAERTCPERCNTECQTR